MKDFIENTKDKDITDMGYCDFHGPWHKNNDDKSCPRCWKQKVAAKIAEELSN